MQQNKLGPSELMARKALTELTREDLELYAWVMSLIAAEYMHFMSGGDSIPLPSAFPLELANRMNEVSLRIRRRVAQLTRELN